MPFPQGGTIDRDYYSRFKENEASDPESAMDYTDLVLQSCDASVRNDTIAEIYEFRANFLSKAFQFNTAILNQQKAVEIYQESNDEKSLARARAALAEMFLRIDEVGKSMNLVYSALETSERLEDVTNVIFCNILLGNMHYQMADLDAAYTYYSAAARLSESINDTYQKIKSTNNISVIKMLKGDFQTGMAICRDNLSKAKENGYDDLLYSVYTNLASIQMNHNLDSAYYYIKQSEPYANNIHYKALFRSNMGLYYQMLGDSRSALKYFNEALTYYRQGDFHRSLAENYRLIYLESLKVNDTVQAFEALQNYLDTDNPASRKDILIQLYTMQNQMNEERLRAASELDLAQKNNVIIMVCFSFLVILGLVYIVYSQKKHRNQETLIRYQLDKVRQEKIQEEMKLKQKQTEYELGAKEDVLKMKKMEEYQTNQLLDGIIENLEKINDSKNDSLEQRKERIRLVIEDLKSNKKDTTWDDLEQYLIKMNSGFYKNLTTAYPNLTINERRLCIFLHMNMTSKEISSITRQNLNSIEMARFRLRKKLGITNPSESFLSFLQQFDD